jgi:DNA-binding FrmR family transcriptional regulator
LTPHSLRQIPFVAFNRKDDLQTVFVARACGLRRVSLSQRFVPSSEGQVRAVRRMIGEDEPCEDIAQQLAAARKALDRAFYEMVSCMIRQEPPPGNHGRTERAGRVAELLARFG